MNSKPLLLDDVQEANLKRYLLEEGDDDFYIGAPSPTVSVVSETSEQVLGYRPKSLSAGFTAPPPTPHNFPPRLGPGALTQRCPNNLHD